MRSLLGSAVEGLRRLAGPGLRRRLLLVTAAMVVAGLAVADIATYRTLKTYLVGRVDQQLDGLSRAATRLVLTGGGGDLAGVLRASGPGQLFVQVRDQNGDVQANVPIRRADAPSVPPPSVPNRLPTPDPTGLADPTTAAAYLTMPSSGAGPDYRGRVGPLPIGQGEVLVAVPLTDVEATLHKLMLTELGVSAAAVLAAVALGALLVRLGLRPLDDVTATADAIAAGRLDRRVEVTDPGSEVGRLGVAFNAMLGRIEDSFAEKEASELRLRRFVADASHELRTPLTSIRGYAELFRRGAQSRPEDLAKSMTRIEEEATRMSVLVEDLLLLARLDQGRPLESLPVDLSTVVGQAVDAARAVEPDRRIDLDVAGPVTVSGDTYRLRQVVDNLLANVRVHTPPDTPAEVTLAVSDGRAVLQVADRGPGLGEAATQVFERFYRVDPSRSAASGGAGLGLSIVSAIVAAHDGSVTAGDRPDGGAVFTVTLPLAEAPLTSTSKEALSDLSGTGGRLDADARG
ncbi:MAG TPA: HAMP domain-containing sensor histidine kinase [Acidimicrobiales bacterium]|nr:HAMP domain-containing sensor histidine kinase [Acidimicrobiales bacterium]